MALLCFWVFLLEVLFHDIVSNLYLNDCIFRIIRKCSVIDDRDSLFQLNPVLKKIPKILLTGSFVLTIDE